MRNPLPTARRLLKLKRLGVRIAVDDFGTGYSSLAYLEQFPIDCLKIDRGVTDAINRSPESKALMHTLVQLGKDLGLSTLAEGVETTAQLAHLRTESLGEAQGFLLAKPMTVDDVEAALFPPTAGADQQASHDAA
jgi:EAL domain-containing protein (putative c-di-GMP-specific phosphodiesterase class I)